MRNPTHIFIFYSSFNSRSGYSTPQQIRKTGCTCRIVIPSIRW